MNIIRIGKVTDIKINSRQVRVHFPDVNIISGWLKITCGSSAKVQYQTSSELTNTESEHTHNVVISPWLPEIGDTVLCIYNPGFNEDGFVLGGL